MSILNFTPSQFHYETVVGNDGIARSPQVHNVAGIYLLKFDSRAPRFDPTTRNQVSRSNSPSAIIYRDTFPGFPDLVCGLLVPSCVSRVIISFPSNCITLHTGLSSGASNDVGRITTPIVFDHPVVTSMMGGSDIEFVIDNAEVWPSSTLTYTILGAIVCDLNRRSNVDNLRHGIYKFGQYHCINGLKKIVYYHGSPLACNDSVYDSAATITV